MALTTLANVKLLLGITGTAQDAQLQAFINSASARVEKWCNRSFGKQDCIEWKDGGIAITAKRTPIKKINRIAYSDGTSFSVAYAGADTWAQVSVSSGVGDTAGVMTLVSSIAPPVELDLDGSVDDLIAAINATPDWEATLNGGTIAGKSAWIAPMAGQDAIGGAEIPVCMGELRVARYDWNSGAIELAPHRMVYSLAGEIEGDPMWDGQTKFPRQFRGILLDYTGGLDPIPDDVQQTCVDLVQMMMQSAANTGMLLQSESIGGYAWAAAGGGNGAASALAAYDNLIKSRLAGYYRIPISD